MQFRTASAKANHTLARWLLLQGNTGTLKGSIIRDNQSSKHVRVISAVVGVVVCQGRYKIFQLAPLPHRSFVLLQGEKKTEGQKRRVGSLVGLLFQRLGYSGFGASRLGFGIGVLG